MSARQVKRWSRRVGLGLGAAVLVLWSLAPIYWSFLTSITPPGGLVADGLRLWPETPSGEHFAKLFGATSQSQGNEVQSVWPQFSAAFANSLITSLLATVLTVILAAFGAWAFVRLPFPGKNVLFVAVVATLAIPAYTVMIPLYRLMDEVAGDFAGPVAIGEDLMRFDCAKRRFTHQGGVVNLGA